MSVVFEEGVGVFYKTQSIYLKNEINAPFSGGPLEPQFETPRPRYLQFERVNPTPVCPSVLFALTSDRSEAIRRRVEEHRGGGAPEKSYLGPCDPRVRPMAGWLPGSQ